MNLSQHQYPFTVHMLVQTIRSLACAPSHCRLFAPSSLPHRGNSAMNLSQHQYPFFKMHIPFQGTHPLARALTPILSQFLISFRTGATL